MALAAAEQARLAPDTLAVTDGTLTLSWAQLDDALNRATHGLIELGLAEGERGAVYAYNSTHCALAYLALLHAGISGVPANFHLTAAELAYILADSGAKLLFVGPETVDVGLEAARMAGVERVIGWGCAGREGVVDWDGWIAGQSAAEPPATMRALPYMHYTSGTTGKPKGTQTPARMFPRVGDVAALFGAMRAEVAAGGPPGPVIMVGPNYHTGPLASIRLWGGGRPLVILPRFDPEAILANIAQHRVVTGVFVPTHFQRLLALPDDVRGRYDLSSLAMVAHTGAACPVDVKRAMIAWWGPVFVDAYGGTEAGTTNMITSAEWLERPGSVGKAVPPLEMVVVGEDGSTLGPNQVGQLYIRDPSGVGIEYHNDPEKTAAAHIAPGVFTLGEVGYVDEEGYVFITDRSSDMIISGGVNIYPAEVEQVLIHHPAVEDVAVIGVPNRDMGEEVKALVVLRPAAAATADDLITYSRANLARYKCPRSIDIVPSVGRNAMGKINKRELRRPFWPSDRTIAG